MLIKFKKDKSNKVEKISGEKEERTSVTATLSGKEEDVNNLSDFPITEETRGEESKKDTEHSPTVPVSLIPDILPLPAEKQAEEKHEENQLLNEPFSISDGSASLDPCEKQGEEGSLPLPNTSADNAEKNEKEEPKGEEYPKKELIYHIEDVSKNEVILPAISKQEHKFLGLLAKYGSISGLNANSILGKKTQLSPAILDMLEVVTFREDQVYFHTEKSLEVFAKLERIRLSELRKTAVFYPKTKEILTEIMEETSILFVLEKACNHSDEYSLFDWLSNYNPRKKQGSLKIRRSDKKGSLTPRFLIILRKTDQKFCLLFDSIPTFASFTLGEEQERWRDILKGYDSILNDSEKKQKWLNKRNIDIPEKNLGVALFTSSDKKGIVEEMRAESKMMGICSPIFMATLSAILRNPLSCWSSTLEGDNSFLEIIKEKKTD